MYGSNIVTSSRNVSTSCQQTKTSATKFTIWRKKRKVEFYFLFIVTKAGYGYEIWTVLDSIKRQAYYWFNLFKMLL